MQLFERLIPTLIVILVAAALAPLCVAAGLDGCGDACCDYSAGIASANWMKVVGNLLGAMLGAVAVALAGRGLGVRSASRPTPHPATSLTLSAVPLRI